MELPIAPQSYQTSPDALIRAVKQVDVILARMVADETELEVARAMTNPDRPTVHLANFAADVRMGQHHNPNDVLDQIAEHFENVGTPCHDLVCNDAEWSDPLAGEAASRGYRPDKRWIYRLNHYVPPARLRTDLQIISGRAAYQQLRHFYHRAAMDHHQSQGAAADDLAATRIDHLDEPRTEVFFGRIDGRPVGVVGLVTSGQIGVINDVFTEIDSRRQGIAATLLDHALDHCQRALFDQVILEVADGSEAIQFIDRFGFEPAISFVRLRLDNRG